MSYHRENGRNILHWDSGAQRGGKKIRYAIITALRKVIVKSFASRKNKRRLLLFSAQQFVNFYLSQDLPGIVAPEFLHQHQAGIRKRP